MKCWPRHLISAWSVPLILAGVAMSLAACDTPQRQAELDAATYPPDFTLVFFVDAQDDWAASNSPRDRSAQHAVTPDRVLRAALGPGVSPRFHPPATATLTAGQMAELFRLAERAIQSEASLPPMSAAARPAIVYTLTLTTDSRPRDLRTTPGRNPAARDLLDLLIRLRGGR